MSPNPAEESRTVAVSIADRISTIGRDAWDSLANPGWSIGPGGRIERTDAATRPFNPFVAHDFLDALEASGTVDAATGWLPQHIFIAEDDGTPRAAVPAYLKSHSRGEYVFDWGWADAFERAGGRYYPKLQVAVPFTPVTGPRLLMKEDGNAAAGRALLAGALEQVAVARRASSVHVTFPEDEDWQALVEAGWLARYDHQFQWFNEGYRDFEDFLAAFASRKRKQIRRERREALADGISIVHRTGADITEADWDAFYEFYTDTGARKWGTPYLNRTFFSLIGERMAERILLIFAVRDGRPIAGALNLIGSDTLFGRYWGAVEDHPFLHFEVCYHQAVDFALAHGLSRVEAGAQGEHKAARGYRPVLTRSAHWIAHSGLRDAVADFLARERPAVEAETEYLAEAGPFRKNLTASTDEEADRAGKAT